MVTSDRRHWRVRSKLELTSFAVSPTDPELVVAATDRGLARSHDGGRRGQPMRGPGGGLLLDWERPDALWAITDDGQLWRSKDAGASWQQRGKINGQPEAFLAHETSLHVAVAQLGIVTSTDQGRSWRVLYREAPPAG
jgi:photosystem II stability/assembly factor-like uncharacterized protein